MKRRSAKSILLFFAALVLVGFTTGYILWNKPHRNIVEAEAVKINAIALYNTFIIDSAGARVAYVNKVLNVSGIVKNISVNQQHQQIILLRTSEPAASINCTMERNAAGIKTGDQVFLKGICIGYIGGDAEMGLPGDVFLVRCYLSI